MQATFDRHDVRLIITAGDNIYAGTRILGLPIGANTGDEDDDWFFTFFQPYRYMVNRVPVYPCIGNHDTGRDRGSRRSRAAARQPVPARALRAATKQSGARRSIRDCSTASATAATSSSSASTRRRRASSAASGCSSTRSTGNGSSRRSRPTAARAGASPFCHHPPFCAGPQHGNTDRMEQLLPLFAQGGVRVVFSGHEHNFQHSSPRRHRLLRHRRRQQGAQRSPDDSSRRTREAGPTMRTSCWSPSTGPTMRVEPIGELNDGSIGPLPRFDRDGSPVTGRHSADSVTRHSGCTSQVGEMRYG